MSTPLSINPTPRPRRPFSDSTTSTCSLPSSPYKTRPISFNASSFHPQRTESIDGLIIAHSSSLRYKRPESGGMNQKSSIAASNTSPVADSRDEDDGNPPISLKTEINSRPRRIALFIEPSPFAYVSGYKNRFQNFIKYLREMGDEVMVVTTHEGVPQEFHGAKLIGSRSFPCPLYQKVPLSLALSPRIISAVARFKPDIIHASSPGIMVSSKIHVQLDGQTHVVDYKAADLTLVPSVALGKELEAARVTTGNKIHLWNKGVDSETFHPRYRSHEMRFRLSNGEPEKPLIVHVGRLGVEKSLDLLKRVMDKLPEARIAFVGDGPFREELQTMFSGMPAVFTGMLVGEELSQAYASGDVFVMPSETETLGFVALEAMSTGLPVVVARAGGLTDIIPPDQEGKTGFCFNPGDADDCANKLKPLLHDRELRESIGKAARKEMEKHDWRAATLKIRNEQYSAAIWFWRKKRVLLLRPFQWISRRLFRPVPKLT